MSSRTIARVAVIGAGAMGRQIALNTARHGYEVQLHDVSSPTLSAAQQWADEYLAGRIEKGRMSEEEVAATRANMNYAASLEQALQAADLVIEAAVEDLDVKRRLFADMDKLAPPHAILATNSSTIVSSRLADVTGRPDKVANLHYFNPALVMELVEVVQGPHTSAETAAALLEFCRDTGKQPIHMKKEIFGFVANRLMHALAAEAFFLMENGYATHEEIDLAAEKALRHPMGPFRLMDLTGIDVGYLVRMEKHRQTELESDKPPRTLVEKYERGEYGRKTGRGWYTYDDN